jgi:hypothetical protein
MRLLRLTSAILGLLVLSLGTSTCNLIAGLNEYDFEDGGVPDGAIPCTLPSECDDDNACTEDRCEGSACVFSATSNGPAPTQLPGDCRVIQCQGGMPSEEPDDGDLPEDDNACTADTCSAGTPHNTPRPDGEACSLNGSAGHCEGGACTVDCGPGLPPCDDGEPCTEDSCDVPKGTCSFAPLEDGTKNPGAADTKGDCKGHVCVGGHDLLVDDDSDLPITPTDCDQELCASGQPSNPPLPADAPCFTSEGAVCDGQGACVACNVDEKCMGPSDDCQHPACVDHHCVTAFIAANTPLSPALQVPGDCKTKVCDGSGGVLTVNDGNDTQNDGNPCTDEVCVDGTPKHPPSVAGTMCGMGMVCSGAGSCVGCVDDSTCIAPATCGGCGVANTCCCKPKTCAELGKSCGLLPDGCGGMVQCNDGLKSGTETDVDCGGSTCGTKCAQGKTCAANGDCATGFCADGVCCDGACGGACQSCNQANKVGQCSPLGAGPDNNPPNACSGTNICVNGTCKKLQGQPCAAGAECTTNQCTDGVCCNASCSGICRSCNVAGSVGTCSSVPAGQQDPVATIPCIGTNACDGAQSCKKGNGQACGGGNECASSFCADGVCCNALCSGVCQGCNVAGSSGTCTNLPLYTNDNAPVCGGISSTCDGMGACLKVNGQPCMQGAECASHTCTGGLCAP